MVSTINVHVVRNPDDARVTNDQEVAPPAPQAVRPLAISVITLGGASHGALSRKWPPRRTAEMLAFYADRFGRVEFGRGVAVEYGRLRAATEALGRPVASNDLWIAGSATANGLPLVTLNRRHFEPLRLHGLWLL